MTTGAVLPTVMVVVAVPVRTASPSPALTVSRAVYVPASV